LLDRWCWSRSAAKINEAVAGLARVTPAALGLALVRPVSRSQPPTRVARERSALPEVGLPSSPVIPLPTLRSIDVFPPVRRPGALARSSSRWTRTKRRGPPWPWTVICNRWARCECRPARPVTGSGDDSPRADPKPCGPLREPPGWTLRSPRVWPLIAQWLMCRPSSLAGCGCCPAGVAARVTRADALSVGVAAHTAPRLHTVQVDEAITALRALIEHREDREDLVRSPPRPSTGCTPWSPCSCPPACPAS
jgi:hypothetical protein